MTMEQTVRIQHSVAALMESSQPVDPSLKVVRTWSRLTARKLLMAVALMAILPRQVPTSRAVPHLARSHSLAAATTDRLRPMDPTVRVAVY